MHIVKPTYSLVFRMATRDDCALIASMHARSWSAAYRGMLPDAYLAHDVFAERAAHWQRRMAEIEAGAACVSIAQQGDEPVGFVCMIVPDDAGSVLVDNLHALPGHKGMGIGSKLLDQAERWAREHGAREMSLSVLERNASAIGFYESRGWIKGAREADHVAGADVFSLRFSLPLDQSPNT
jgi:ribosomal protein S18 acetylase RimI-like enzyme